MKALVEEPWLTTMEDTVPCPKCRVVISRAEGCDDFRCTCSHTFKFNDANWPTVGELQGEIDTAAAAAAYLKNRKRNIILHTAILAGDVGTVARCVTDWPHLLVGGAIEMHLITPAEVAWLHNQAACEAVILQHTPTAANSVANKQARTIAFTKEVSQRVARATKHGNTAEVARLVARCPAVLVQAWPHKNSPIPLQLAALFGETETATLLAKLTPLAEMVARRNYDGRNAAEEAMHQHHWKTAAAITAVVAARSVVAVATVATALTAAAFTAVDLKEDGFEMVAKDDSADGWSMLDEDTSSDGGVESASEDEAWTMLHIRTPTPTVASVAAVATAPPVYIHRPTITIRKVSFHAIPIKHRIQVAKDLLTTGPEVWWEGDHPRYYAAYLNSADGEGIADLDNDVDAENDLAGEMADAVNGKDAFSADLETRTVETALAIQWPVLGSTIAKSLAATGTAVNYDERRVRGSSVQRWDEKKYNRPHSGVTRKDQFNAPFDHEWYGLTKQGKDDYVQNHFPTDGRETHEENGHTFATWKNWACDVMEGSDDFATLQRRFMTAHNTAITTLMGHVPSAATRAVPLGKDPEERFMRAYAATSVQPRLAFHGTDPKNLSSIYRRGLLVPGGTSNNGNGILVAHGSAHGRGIYTAKQPSLSHGFAAGSGKIIACAVLDPSAGPLAERMVVPTQDRETPAQPSMPCVKTGGSRALDGATDFTTTAGKRAARRLALRTRLNAAAGTKGSRPKHKGSSGGKSFNNGKGSRSAAAKQVRGATSSATRKPINHHGDAMVIFDSSVVVPMYEVSYTSTDFKYQHCSQLRNTSATARTDGNQRGIVQAGMGWKVQKFDYKYAKRQLRTFQSKASVLERKDERKEKSRIQSNAI
jgi:hypothetical protein